MNNIHFPLQVISGSICDANGNVLLKANRDTATTPLLPTERDSLIVNVCELLNREYIANGAYAVIYEDRDGGIGTTEFRTYATETEAP